MASLAASSLSFPRLQLKPTNLSRQEFMRAAPRTHLFSDRRSLIPSPFPIKTHLPVPFQPLSISSLPKISCSQTPNCRISLFLRSFAEKTAILLVGSLLFLGRFSGKPAWALDDTQRSNLSSLVEEKMDTQQGKEDEVEMYERILEKKPTDVEALKVVLYGKMRKGKPKEALGYVERLIALEPDEVEWRLLQALTYELMGQLGKAKKLFKEILKERPLLLRALHGLALAMHKNREGPAVFEMLNKALKLAQQEHRVTEERNIKILIAQMHVVKGDLEEALKQFQDLINENPRDFRPYLCQGIIYSLLDKKKEADEQFENYRSLIPDEFPQKGFIDDVILAAKTESQERLEKEFESEFSYKK